MKVNYSANSGPVYELLTSGNILILVGKNEGYSSAEWCYSADWQLKAKKNNYNSCKSNVIHGVLFKTKKKEEY